MKKTLLAFILLISFNNAIAQNDIILKTNGEEMVGKVNAINQSDLSFVYQNETIVYTVQKADIVKITFSSGRVEFFNKTMVDNQSTHSLEEHHNKVAILPFAYLKNEGSEGSNAMSNKIQQETYQIYNHKKVNLNYLDPNTTNALLIKAGINNGNRNGYTMGEICNILGVEFVIQGTVSVEKSDQTSFSNTSVQTRSNSSKAFVDNNGNIIGDIWGNKNKSTNASTISTNIQNYASSINMNIYNDKGDNIFSQEHESFWQMQDAYKITLSFLAKKSPLYKK